MKKIFLNTLSVIVIVLFSCQKESIFIKENQEAVLVGNNLIQTNLKATNKIQTYWGYTSERYLESKKIHRFNSTLWEVGWNPDYDYIVDHIEVTKEIIIPDGYTAVVENTPTAGYLPNSGYKRGISGKMAGNKLVMTTWVYAVRTQYGTGVAVDKYMPKIHINSNNLQELPWNIRIFEKQNLIAHRGFHDNNTCDLKENSVGSFVNAQEKEVYGSEIDVWVTKDGIPVVYHDNKFYGYTIVETNYSVLKDRLICGNTKLPTLEHFLNQAKKSNTTRLVLDLKPCPNPYSDENRDKSNTDIIMDAIKNSGMAFSSIDYLSFSKIICEKVATRSEKKALVYLLVDKNNNPQYDVCDLKNRGINGLSFDYQYLYMNGNFSKIDNAKSAGMKINVWTVNDMQFVGVLFDAGVDYISTDSLSMF